MVADLDGEIGRITSPDAYLIQIKSASFIHTSHHIPIWNAIWRGSGKMFSASNASASTTISSSWAAILFQHCVYSLRFAKIRCPSTVGDAFQEATTVAQLARLISENSDNDQWSSLVPIQPLGDKTPLFCIHGLTGDVLWFRRLGELLAPHQPFYGVRHAVSTAFRAVRRYGGNGCVFISARIKRVQPEGYFLGGASRRHGGAGNGIN